MSDETMAANNTEVANPNTEVTTTTTEVQGNVDVTKTQIFAHRLKEETSKAAQSARDALIAEQGYEWNGKPITTEADYKQALKEVEMKKQLSSDNLPDEVVNELVESKKFRQQYEAEQESKRSEKAKQKDQIDFLDYFKTKNGRDFDSSKDNIPAEVWEENSKGTSLKKAYSDHYKETRIKELEAELETVKKGEKVKQANEENASTATGSVTGNGNSTDNPLTPEMIETMSPSELAKRWQEVKKVMKMK